MKRLPRLAGFSLMELLAVVVIIGVVAALLVPRVSVSSDAAKHKACLHNHTEIDISVERYYLHNGSWPANDLSDIAADPDYFPDGLRPCPVTGAAYQLDPTTHRVLGHSGPTDHGP
jgi:general secretion pathway protein G